jgi:hypothetical protein
LKILEEAPSQKVVKAAVTDDDGNFNLVLNTPGAYVLTVEFLGKKTAAIPFVSEDKLLRDFGNLGGSYVDIKANNDSGLKNSGFGDRVYGGAQYTLPRDIMLNVNGNYSTSNINLQGESNGYYFYNVSVSKIFLKNAVFRNHCFLPVWRDENINQKGAKGH